jgi:hypothetical protein
MIPEVHLFEIFESSGVPIDEDLSDEASQCVI